MSTRKDNTKRLSDAITALDREFEGLIADLYGHVERVSSMRARLARSETPTKGATDTAKH